ncbi:MAG: hypothetical protein ACXIUM_00620, partial [Wenzhouxiangella sp.]
MPDLLRAALLCLTLLLIASGLSAAPLRSSETFGAETFDVWHLPGDDFKLYCRQPCAADAASIQAYYMNFRAQLPALIDWHGVDVIDELKPVEMHINTSSICPQLGGAAGYAKTDFRRGWDDRRGVTCLFEVERGEPLDRRNHVLSLHEYAHIILFERHRWSYEFFTYWSSWQLVEPNSPMADPCSAWYESFDDTRTVHRLCRDFGLTQGMVRDSLVELDRRFRARQGWYHLQTDGGYTTSAAELRGLFDSLLGADTSAAWIAGGWTPAQVGLEFSVGPSAASYVVSDGQLRLHAPAGALSQRRDFRLDVPGNTPGYVPMSYGSHTLAVVPDGASDASINQPEPFAQPLELAITPTPFFLSDRPLADYHLVQLRHGAGGQPYWAPVPGSHFDPGSGQVVGRLDSSGAYAYGPRFRMPAGLFYDPAYDGHGFDVQMSGDQVGVLIYTYEANGDPIWLLGNAPLGSSPDQSASYIDMPLLRFDSPGSGQPLQSTQVGRLQLQFFGGWDGNGWNLRAFADIQINGITPSAGLRLNLEPVPFGRSVHTEVQTTGQWFDPSDPNWGFSIDRKDDIEAAVAYFYDSAGAPRWALGNRRVDQPELELLGFRGSCLGCPGSSLSFQPAGSLRLEFAADG